MPLDFSEFNKKAGNPVLDTTGFDNPDMVEEPGVRGDSPKSKVLDFSEFDALAKKKEEPKKSLLSAFSNPLKDVAGVGETALNMLSSIPSFVTGTAGKLGVAAGGLATGTVPTGKDFEEGAAASTPKLFNDMTYEPRTEPGKAISSGLGQAFDVAGRAPGAAIQSALSGGGQSGAKALMNDPNALGPNLSNLAVQAAMVGEMGHGLSRFKAKEAEPVKTDAELYAEMEGAKETPTLPPQEGLQQGELPLEPTQNPYGVDTSKFVPDENGIPVKADASVPTVDNAQADLFSTSPEKPPAIPDTRPQGELTTGQPIPYEKVKPVYDPTLVEAPKSQEEGLPYKQEVGSDKVNASIEDLKQQQIDLSFRQKSLDETKDTLTKEEAFSKQEELRKEQEQLDTKRQQLFEDNKVAEPSQSSKTIEPILGDTVKNRKPLGGTGRSGFGQGGAINFGKKVPTFEEFKESLAKDIGKVPDEDIARNIYEQKYKQQAVKQTLEKIPGFKAANKEKLKTENTVANILHSTRTMGDINTATGAKSYKEAQANGYKGGMVEHIQSLVDEPKMLQGKAKILYEQYIQPLKDRGAAAYSKISELSPNDPMLAGYTPRISAQKGFWNRFFSGLGSNVGGGFNFGKTPGALKERTVFKLGDKIISQLPDGGYLISKDKQTTYMPPIETSRAVFRLTDGKMEKSTQAGKATLREGLEINGEKVTQATQKEIEANTDLKYLHDPMFVSMIKVQELEKYSKQLEALEQIKQLPMWKEMTSDIQDNNPNHVGLKYGDKIPSLRNTRFDPDLAHVFDDYLRPGAQSSLAQVVEGFNNLAIKSFLLLPIKHIDNEGVHYVVANGLTGMLPTKAKAVNLAKGLDDVRTFSPEYIDVARNGGSLLYPRTLADGWMENTLEHLKSSALSDGTMLSTLTEMGLKPVEFFNAWSHLSSNIMWMTRDGLYMALIREAKDKNPTMTIAEAVEHVEQYMPNYRLPTKVLGSRALSEVMQNPALTVFSRYHYGALKAIGTSVKNAVGGEGVAGIPEGLNHIAAYTFMAACVYPFLSMAFHAMGGRQDQEPRWAGGFHYIKMGVKVAQGALKGGLQPDTSFYTSSMLTPSPAPLAMFEDIENRTMWNGKRISNSQDPKALQAIDRLSYPLTETINPAGLGKVARDAYDHKQPIRESFNQWAWSQLADIETTTKKKQAGINSAALKDKAESAKEMGAHPWRRAFK